MSKPKAYYNEIDPFCVEWLNNLIKAGLIAEAAKTFIEAAIDGSFGLDLI